MTSVNTDPKRVAARRRRVLLVDDSATFLHAVMEELRKDGHDLVTAGSAEEALSLLKQGPVDCILMDLVLPGMDGIEATRLIRLDSGMATVPILMFTASFESQTMAEALGAGVDAFCPKASDLGLLRSQVRNLLRRRNSETELPVLSRKHAASNSASEPASLFDQVVATCGLAPVVAATTIARACQRASVDPEILDVDKLIQSLPFIRDALRIFLTEHETRRRMVKLEALAYEGRFVTAMGAR